MMTFRRSNPNARMPREEAKRQGDIATLAFLMLDGRESAITFLNGANDELGGRPIDLAIASEDGFERVKLAIKELAGGRAAAE
jgi:uncharacterized protein (DUF2384 family)